MRIFATQNHYDLTTLLEVKIGPRLKEKTFKMLFNNHDSPEVVGAKLRNLARMFVWEES